MKISLFSQPGQRRFLYLWLAGLALVLLWFAQQTRDIFSVVLASRTLVSTLTMVVGGIGWLWFLVVVPAWHFINSHPGKQLTGRVLWTVGFWALAVLAYFDMQTRWSALNLTASAHTFVATVLPLAVIGWFVIYLPVVHLLSYRGQSQ